MPACEKHSGWPDTPAQRLPRPPDHFTPANILLRELPSVAIDNQMGNPIKLVVKHNHTVMTSKETTAQLLREVVRLFIRDQRESAACMDGGQTVRCHILNELLRNGPLPQQALVERLGLDKGWISRAVDALSTEGSLTRQVNELDKRSVMLTLTAHGKARATSLDAQLNGHAETLLACVSPDQQAAFHSALQSLKCALHNPDEKSRTTCQK
ncbi:winged helix-turn-helix transcriptional regulator [Duganella sp. LX20W]|uniref:Winged helix-turn-helix transcriptional regulator n=1 Tax=Rugamonas brunnea TaxID=2758569 RepID=A0A7W2ID37_9BURK|nr:MarR family winged helix-turn-helix transcriptional regulator [Rugamonas brunnea]MBA5638607.1 winged helix-turn-helix transcriptional regulator [Rugamonas brunnea]